MERRKVSYNETLDDLAIIEPVLSYVFEHAPSSMRSLCALNKSWRSVGRNKNLFILAHLRQRRLAIKSIKKYWWPMYPCLYYCLNVDKLFPERQAERIRRRRWHIDQYLIAMGRPPIYTDDTNNGIPIWARVLR